MQNHLKFKATKLIFPCLLIKSNTPFLLPFSTPTHFMFIKVDPKDFSITIYNTGEGYQEHHSLTETSTSTFKIHPLKVTFTNRDTLKTKLEDMQVQFKDIEEAYRWAKCDGQTTILELANYCKMPFRLVNALINLWVDKKLLKKRWVNPLKNK